MRKGQVSLFIIIGLIILVVTSIALYLVSSERQQEFETQLALPEETVVLDTFQPIQQFVKECAIRTARQGIEQAGLHGGYVSYEPRIVGDGSTFYNELQSVNLDEPTESSRLIQDGYDIPYWSYNYMPNSFRQIKLSSLMPKLKRASYVNLNDYTIFEYENDNSIEAQLDRYMYYNLESCFNNFRLFKDQNFDIEIEENVKPLVTVNDGYVNVFVYLPMTVSLGDTTQKIEYFQTDLNVDFKGAYESAKDVWKELHTRQPFLNDFTMQMIFETSGLERGSLPPLYEVRTNERAESWSVPVVEELFTYNLMTYLGDLQIPNTRNYIPQQDIVPIDGSEASRNIAEFEQAGHTIRQYDLLQTPRNNLEMEFMYLKWPVHFAIDQAWANRYLTGMTIDNYIQFNRLGQTIYDFSYTFAYPVMLTIRDPEGFSDIDPDGDGFSFNVAYEVNVKSNSVEINAPNSLLSPDEELDEEVITQFCDPSQQLLQTEINVFDDDGLYLEENPEFMYSCDGGINEVACIMTPEDDYYYFPTCMNAKITFIEDGFERRKFSLGAMMFGDYTDQFNFTLARERPMNYDMYKIIESRIPQLEDRALSSLISNPEEDEIVEVRLQRVANHLDDPEYFNVIYFEDGDQPELNMLPGFYKVDGTYLKEIPTLYEEQGSDFIYKRLDYSGIEIDDNYINQMEADGDIFLTEMPYGILDTTLEVERLKHLRPEHSTWFIFPTLNMPPSKLSEIGGYSSLFYTTANQTNRYIPQWIEGGAR